jgi:hypothetical protein
VYSKRTQMEETHAVATTACCQDPGAAKFRFDRELRNKTTVGRMTTMSPHKIAAPRAPIIESYGRLQHG